jgi:tRNA modification GTPase
MQKAVKHIDSAFSHWEQLEILAEELRYAHSALGEITGEFSADDLLGVIFSEFCIGK